jgi:PAS domain-containing protein
VFLTAGPFTTQANDRVREESIGMARLYARQLVRLNQQAVIDQNYSGLLASLDARRGDTTGLIRSYILDANKAQVLAPAELLGQAFSQFEVPEIGQAASLAIAQDKEHVQLGSDGVAFVSAPIRVRVGEENKTVATAFVVYSYLSNQFTVAELTSRVVTSLLLAFVFCFVLIFFAYRWTEGSLQRVASSIDDALKKNETQLRSPVDWPPLAELCEQISFALGRSSSGSGSLDNGANFGGVSEWATQFVNLNGVAAFALNGSQQVTAWNPKLERILGVRSSLAIGQDFTQVSPDVSLESSVKQGLEQSRRDPGSMFRGSVELNGVNHALAVVSHSGSSLVSLIPAEEG